MKYIVKRRLRGQRIVFVLASRPERARPNAATPTAIAAIAALYMLRRLGRASGVSSGERTEALPGDEIVPHPTAASALLSRVWGWVAIAGRPCS